MGLVWRKDDLLTLSEKQISMANETCQQKIYAGIDVELSGGTEHFSLETHDQANIESMFTAVTLGAKEQQYHCDGQDLFCRRCGCVVRSLQELRHEAHDLLQPLEEVD